MELGAALRDPAHGTEALDLLRGLIDKVTLTPAEDRFNIELEAGTIPKARQRGPDETVIRALARAHRWKRLLEDGKYRSAGELAEAEGVTRSSVNRLLRLTLLSPDIVEAIFDGRQRRASNWRC